MSIRQKGDGGFCVCLFPYFCRPHRYYLQGEHIGTLINHELPIYIRYLRTALNECSMLCFWLSSQSGQTQNTVGQNHWCCAGGRRWCCAGSPSALMLLLCVWCVVGIGARAHRERDGKRYILRPPQILRMRGRVRVRVHGTGGVLARASRRLSERLHCRWPKQGAAVAKQGVLAS